MENKHELVKKAISGDVEAFETLLQSKRDKLYRTAFLYARNKEDTLDILQETAYQAFLSIKNMKQPEYFDTWLIRILIRVSSAILKKKKLFILDNEVSHTAVDNVNIEKTSNSQLLLSEAINNLSSDYKTVIILFYYHDLKIKDISEIIGRPENTVKTHLRRARCELRNYLEEE